MVFIVYTNQFKFELKRRALHRVNKY